MKKRIDLFAYKILDRYVMYMTSKGRRAFTGDQEKKLALLHPGISSRKLITEYYAKKISQILLASLAIAVIIVLVMISRLTSDTLTDENSLQRHDVGDGDYSVSLSAVTDEHDYGSIDVIVRERELDVSECERLMDELYEYLLGAVIKDNDSLEHIDSDLYMPVSVDGYPFSLRWESSDYMLIDTAGNVNDEKAEEEGTPAQLNVIMTYHDVEKTYDIKAVIYPKKLEGDALLLDRLRRLISVNDAQSINSNFFELPDTVDGKVLTWHEMKEPVIPVIIAIGICMLLGIWLGNDRDLKKRYEDRNRQLVIEYAEFVSKLQILLSSGKTIRGSLESMADDYKRTKEKGGNEKYVYEELSVCIKKLGDGMNEAACYEYFGSRCNVLCYKKLAAMLVQNLRKGTDGLIEAMDNEVHMAFEERKAVARKMGEEAQTKLMLPMMLMLSVVMIIIMIPAYLSFGGM